MRRSSLAALLALGCLAAQGHAAAPGAAPDVGTWTPRGRYTSPGQRRRFLDLFRKPPQAIPRYPVVLVHGIVGWKRASLGPVYFDYFNGVATDLRSRGVPVLVTKSTSFESIEARAQQVWDQVRTWMAMNGYEKVNLVAHSMGGLDARHLVTHLAPDKVASLTTVSSPHHGSWYADFALEWVFDRQKFRKVWDKLGIPFAAIPQMSTTYVEETFNPATPDVPGVRYFSFSGRQPFFLQTPPLTTMGIIMTLIEKRMAGERPNLRERLMARLLIPGDLRKRLAEAADLPGVRATWLVPGLVGKNDGIIPSSSAIWGEHLVTLKADHFDQLGWLGTFNQRRFYRNICRMLLDAGL